MSSAAISSSGPPAKRDKLSREVLDLLSGSAAGGAVTALPPIVPSFPASHYRPSKKTAVEPSAASVAPPLNKRTKWMWAPFTSSARTDGALFHHWVKSHVEYPDYPYARFDVHLDPLAYTEGEYELFCKGTEKDADEGYAPWTKSETDILLELCKTYELRWPVIYDRYHLLLEEDGTKGRTMEELQYRYYSIATALTEARVDKAVQEEVEAVSALNEAATAAAAGSATPIDAPAVIPPQLVKQAMKHRIVSHIGTGASTREFNFQKERARRHQLELSWTRSRKEELEDAKLREELKLIEGQLRKLKKSGKHILAAHEAASAAAAMEGGMPVAEDASSMIETASTTFDPSFSSSGLGKHGIPYLQSSRLVPPTATAGGALNKTLLKKLELTLQELKIPERPIATKRSCDAYDIARKSILTLLTLQKIASQKEKDVGMKQQRLVKVQNAAVAAKARAAAAAAAREDVGGSTWAFASVVTSANGTATKAASTAAKATVGVTPSSSVAGVPAKTTTAKPATATSGAAVERGARTPTTTTTVSTKSKATGGKTMKPGTGSTKFKKKANITSTDASATVTSTKTEGGGEGGRTSTGAKGKKRKTSTTPKKTGEGKSAGGVGKLAVVPNITTCVANAGAAVVATSGLSPVLSSTPGAGGEAGKSVASNATTVATPLVPVAAASTKSTPSAAGSEDGKPSKKRAKSKS